MILTQPDDGRPERLIASCAQCGGLYVAQGCEDWAQAVLLEIPSADQILGKAIAPTMASPAG